MGRKSPFPADFFQVHLNYNGSFWTTGDDLSDAGASIQHGATSEGGAYDVSALSFALHNAAGKYSPRNPTSPLYGLIGRNTPAQAVCYLGAPWLTLIPGTFAWVPDSAALSTTGDLDIRWWGELPTWDSRGTLIAKWSGVQRSWLFEAAGDGLIRLWWSTDGANSRDVTSTLPVPSWAGEVALRATLDVNNGAGGSTVTFYYATDLDGDWVRLGEPITLAGGTLSTFDGTANVTLTPADDGLKLYGWEVRHGIGGTVATSGRTDRFVKGWDRDGTIQRSNLFYDPVPAGSVATWASDANGAVGVIQDPVHGKVIETTGISASTSAQPMIGHHSVLAASTTYKVAFDVLFEGGGSASAINLYWRPVSATSSTGQVIMGANLQNYTSGWTRVETTFTTTVTAPLAPATMVINMPGAYTDGSRVLMRNVVLSQGTPTDMSVFSGDDANSSTAFYYWTAGKYVSPSVKYGATASGTTFSDDQGRYWGYSGSNLINNRHILMKGEVSEWPVDWEKTGENSVVVDVTAQGVRRRMGQGKEGTPSVLYRTFSARSDSLIGYWPMEDGTDSTGFGPADGTYTMTRSAGVVPASYANFRGSAPLPVFGPGWASTRVKVDDHTLTGKVQVRWVQWTPGDYATNQTVDVKLVRIRFSSSGSIGFVDMGLTKFGNMGVFGYTHGGDGEDPVELAGSANVVAPIPGTSQRMSLELEQVGSTVNWRWTRLQPFAGGGLTYSSSFTFPHTFGKIVSIQMNPGGQDLKGIAMGHLTVENQITSIYDVAGSALEGYIGETAGNRIDRLALENGVPTFIRGTLAETSRMGEQQESTLLELLQEAADADGGILSDTQDSLSLRYRTQRSLFRQPAVVIPYQDNLILPFKPVDDDNATRNRVTVSRVNGSEYTEQLTEGSMSVQPPEEGGVGPYDESLALNLQSDSQIAATAQWRLHTGTWDEARYPEMGVDLAHPRFLGDPLLTRQILAMRVGDRLVIEDPPSWLPPMDVDVLVTGIRYTVTPHHFRINWTCIPARPYNVGQWNAGARYSGEGSSLFAGITSTATSLTVQAPLGTLWTHADGDYDIVIGGERMTVKDVVGSIFTVLRSVNGVVKSHLANAPVELAEKAFYAR